MKAKLILLLAAVILISGCIGSGVKTDPNNGLIVNEFSADPINAEADDLVSFFADVENVGGTTATCVTSELFGVDSWYDEFGQPISLLQPFIPTRGLSFNWFDGIFNACYTDVKLGRICIGGDTKNGDYSLSGFIRNTFLGFSNQFCGSLATTDPRYQLVKFRPELASPVPSQGRPGQSFTAEWRLRPPVLPEGTQITYPVTARTSYFYSTNAVMNIQAYSKSEFKRRTDLGQPTASPLIVQNSFGSPIQIIATRGPSPIVVNPYSLEGPIQYETYRFEFANVGNGFPLPFNIQNVESSGFASPDIQGGFIFATLKVDGPGAFFSDCLGQSGTEVFIGGNVIQDLVKLRADQRVPIGCTIAIDRILWQDKPLGTISFTFNLWYRYYIDKTVNVNVKGVEGLSGKQIVGF